MITRTINGQLHVAMAYTLPDITCNMDVADIAEDTDGNPIGVFTVFRERVRIPGHPTRLARANEVAISNCWYEPI